MCKGANGVICASKYSKVWIITLPMLLVESGLNNEQISLMRPICIEIEASGFNSEGGLNFE